MCDADEVVHHSQKAQGEVDGDRKHRGEREVHMRNKRLMDIYILSISWHHPIVYLPYYFLYYYFPLTYCSLAVLRLFMSDLLIM